MAGKQPTRGRQRRRTLDSPLARWPFTVLSVLALAYGLPTAAAFAAVTAAAAWTIHWGQR